MQRGGEDLTKYKIVITKKKYGVYMHKLKAVMLCKSLQTEFSINSKCNTNIIIK